MTESRKQSLYLEILERILPLLRNLETAPRWRRLTRRSLFPELELVHNLHRCLVRSEYTEEDVHWLSYQARLYVREGRGKGWPSYEAICRVLTEIEADMPEALRSRLTWRPSQESGGPV